MDYKWKVVPLCEEQLLDINPQDVLCNGLFRKCDVYKSGGGYDIFPKLFYKRKGYHTNPTQFVVQLYDCHLRCPYCYVTPNGIWNEPVELTSKELVEAFVETGLDVFHLMGGSPALYIEYWPEIIDMLDNYGQFIFHSDLLLTEKRYNRPLLKAISQENCLYAVNIKGVTSEDYKNNTCMELDSSVFWLNFYDLVVCDVPFYVTFTNPDMNNYEIFCDHVRNVLGPGVLEDAFVIELKEYKAVSAFVNK
jgi:uncharacterized Fe-S cluster-containing radical SAM superfamily protein